MPLQLLDPQELLELLEPPSVVTEAASEVTTLFRTVPKFLHFELDARADLQNPTSEIKQLIHPSVTATSEGRRQDIKMSEHWDIMTAVCGHN